MICESKYLLVEKENIGILASIPETNTRDISLNLELNSNNEECEIYIRTKKRSISITKTNNKRNGSIIYNRIYEELKNHVFHSDILEKDKEKIKMMRLFYRFN